MRCFAAIAIPPSAGIVVERAIAAVEVSDRVRLAQADHLHVTLCFYGEVAAADLDRLQASLTEVGGATAPFSLAVVGGGAFTRARVVWAGVVGDLESLQDLQRRVADATASFGTSSRVSKPDERGTYTPHITVARHATGVDAAALTAQLRNAPAGRPFTVESIVLYESIGGRYVPRSEHPLG